MTDTAQGLVFDVVVLQAEHGCRDTASKQNVRTVFGRVPLLRHKAC